MSKKESYITQSMYVLPKTSQCYVAILKTPEILNSTEYFIIRVRNLYKYLSNHKKEKIFILKYYVIDDFDISIFEEYNNINSYTFENENIIYKMIEEKYNNIGIVPRLNFTKNKNIFCSKCKYLPKIMNELSKHLQDCFIYRYSLFNEKVPKEVLRKSKENLVFEKQMEKIDKRIHNRSFDSVLSEVSQRLCYDMSEKNYILPDDKAFVYIGEARHWESRYFKIGKVSSKGLLKSRLIQYNTGRIKDFDDFYFLYLFPVDNNKNALKLEKRIKERFKEYQVKSSEILEGVSLEELKNFIKYIRLKI